MTRKKSMTRMMLLLSVVLMVAGCEKKTEPEPLFEVTSKKPPTHTHTMVKKHTGIYDGQVIKKLQSADPYLRLGMGDFKLVIPDSAAKDRKIAEYFDQWISVKGDMNGDEFVVSEWLD